MVVNELRGEKIDVVPWSADPAQFVANALQPAKVKEVITDPTTQTAMVVVPDYQLSLAIGKEGQNARLAARLTGWRIDIKSETQHAEELRAPRAAVPAVEEVPPEPRVVVEPAPADDEKKAGAEADDELASVEPAPVVVEESVEG
jgi:N utilization substance protein A